MIYRKNQRVMNKIQPLDQEVRVGKGEMDADLQKNRNAMQLLVVPRREV